MAVRWLVVLLIALSCHNDPPPEEPVPVSSTGTPIGFLIDDHDMHLSTAQLGDVRGIDQILFRQLQDLDKANKKLGSASGGVADTSPPPVQPIGRGRHRYQQANNGSARRGGGNNAAAVDKLADERMELVRAAVVRVFTVLDATQRERAKEVLSDHDIDLDFDAPPQQVTDEPPPAMPRHHHPHPSDGDDASEQAPPPVQAEPQPEPPPPPPPPPPAIPPPTIPAPSQSAAPPPTIPPPSKAK